MMVGVRKNPLLDERRGPKRGERTHEKRAALRTFLFRIPRICGIGSIVPERLFPRAQLQHMRQKRLTPLLSRPRRLVY
jgi:hypothetical protein